MRPIPSLPTVTDVPATGTISSVADVAAGAVDRPADRGGAGDVLAMRDREVQSLSIEVADQAEPVGADGDGAELPRVRGERGSRRVGAGVIGAVGDPELPASQVAIA